MDLAMVRMHVKKMMDVLQLNHVTILMLVIITRGKLDHNPVLASTHVMVMRGRLDRDPALGSTHVTTIRGTLETICVTRHLPARVSRSDSKICFSSDADQHDILGTVKYSIKNFFDTKKERKETKDPGTSIFQLIESHYFRLGKTNLM